MSRLRRATALLVFVLVSAVAVAGCGLNPFAGGARTMTVEFKDAAGLFKGNDVGVLGVRIGQVTAIKPAGDHVRVTLRIDDPSVKIPADAGAVIVSRSVATDRYVEITPVYDGGAQMADGAVVPLARTGTPVEFDGLLAAVRQISDGLAGAEGTTSEGHQGPLGALLAATAKTFDGQGAVMRDGLSDLATVLESVQGNLGDVEGTVDNLDTLTATLADHDDLIQRFVGQVSSATTMLDDQHEALESAFDALAAMVKEVARFVRTHRGQIDSQLTDFVSLAQTLTAHQRQLEGLLDNGPLMLQNLIRAIDDKDRLAFRTRPISLIPGEEAVRQVCAALKIESCDGLANLPIWDLLGSLSGERDR